MLFHRALTLKQIIATTKFGDQGFGKEKKLMETMKEVNQNENRNEGGQSNDQEEDMSEKLLDMIEYWKPKENEKKSVSEDMKTLKNGVQRVRSRRKTRRDKNINNNDNYETIEVF